MRIRVILADDHPVLRVGVRTIIESSGVGDVVAEASSADELIALLATTDCDVLVTDFSMPGGPQADGFAMLSLIRRRYPDLPILLLSMASNPSILNMAASAGVLGLLDKASSLDELPLALQIVYRGTPYVSKSLQDRIAESGSEAVIGAGKKPSPREMEVLRLLASGLSVTQIALQLHRSVTTVSRQKTNAMRKMGIDNDAQLFEFLRNQGFSS